MGFFKPTKPGGQRPTCDSRSILMAMKAHRDWGEETKGITDCPLCLGCAIMDGTKQCQQQMGVS